MNQMEHNVKIKGYKGNEQPPPYLHYENILNRNQRYPDFHEQSKMYERFKLMHWKSDSLRLAHDDKVATLRVCTTRINSNQGEEHDEISQHRLAHLQGIKDNLEIANDRFYRTTQLEKPGAVNEQLGDSPLYKIINDGKPITY